MKIAYCLPDTYKPGGIERVVCLKANFLADKVGYDVSIITTGQGNKVPYYEFSNKVKFYDLSINYDEMLNENFIQRLLIRSRKRKKHKVKLKELLIGLNADIVISTLTHEADFFA